MRPRRRYLGPYARWYLGPYAHRGLLVLLMGWCRHGGGALELVLDAPRDVLWLPPARNELVGDVGLDVRFRAVLHHGDGGLPVPVCACSRPAPV